MCDEVIIGSREKSLQFCLKEHSASLTNVQYGNWKLAGADGEKGR
jgi:hypothetical protein